MSKSKTTSLLLLFVFFFAFFSKALPANATLAEDAEAYEKYPLYEKYEKKQKYDKYKKLQRIKKQLGFDDPKKKAAAKDGYLKYKIYLKNKTKNKAYAQYLAQYKAYKKYKKYSDYGEYKKYKNYDKDKYEGYKKYGSKSYKDGYNRYKAFTRDLGNVTSNRGPQINVGLWSASKDDLVNEPFKITGSKQFNVTNCASNLIGQVPVGQNARVTYVEGSSGTLRTYNDTSSITQTDVPTNICMEASDGNSDDMIFDVNKPGNEYDHYRGKIKVQHSNTQDNEDQEGTSRRIWMINMLPLEHYVWGFGEIGGGVDEHSKAMLVAARTYARWYLQPTVTKWHEEGFNVLSNSGSQIYRGYDYETEHPTIPELARKTNGIIMKNQLGDIVLAAYGSWTDGRTRKYEDGLFGSSCKSATSGDTSVIYPELSAVNDPYGKNSSIGTCDLAKAGNHMVGMSANGSLVLARDHSWSWARILGYYYSKISIMKEY